MNESGLKPVEYKVLILPVVLEEKTKGGIIMPQEALEKETFAQSKGKIVAVGAIAFTDPDWLDKPKVGDIVMYDKYSGSIVKGKDGLKYRLINDKEIGAVLI